MPHEKETARHNLAGNTYTLIECIVKNLASVKIGVDDQNHVGAIQVLETARQQIRELHWHLDLAIMLDHKEQEDELMRIFLKISPSRN